jgi:multiple sugar transport system substrate-binding protein
MLRETRYSLWVGAAALAAVLAVGTIGADKAQAWSLEEAAKPYAGTEVRGICDGYAPCMSYVDLTAEFEEITGIKVNFDISDLAAIQTQFLTDQITESQYYDLVEVVSFSTGVFPAQGFVHDWSTFTGNSALKDPEVNYEADLVPALYEVSTLYDGNLYSVPTKYVLAFMVYRHDLVNDEEMTNFKAAHGYDMPLPPTTWGQYRDLAAFYTRKKGETMAGQVLENDFYGTIVPFKRHLAVLYDYERILLNMGGRYTDENGNVAIDEGDAAVKALEFMLSLRPYSTLGYMEATWDEEYSEMCNGNVFIMFTWGDTTPYLEIPGDCPGSAGKMTYFAHPGAGLSFAEANNWMIPKSAKNPEAAYLFAQWINRKDIQARTMPMGGNPTRSDVYTMPEWSDPSWVNIQRDQLYRWLEENGKLVARPNPPAWLAWTEIFTEELSNAGAGYQDAATTIANIAERMREAAKQ